MGEREKEKKGYFRWFFFRTVCHGTLYSMARKDANEEKKTFQIENFEDVLGNVSVLIES